MGGRNARRLAFGTRTTDGRRDWDKGGPADMLRFVLAPNGDGLDGVLVSGIVAAADDLLAFVDWIAEGGGSEYDGEVIQRVGDGIQHRLRVLAEMARRMRDAVNVDAAKRAAS